MKTQIKIKSSRRMTVYRFVFLFFLFVLNASVYGQKPGKVYQASVDDFQIGIDSSLSQIILDVRDSMEFIQNKIPRAVFAPSKAVLNTICDTLDSEINIFVYCSDGERSRVVCELLLNKGFEHVFNLKKGLIAWQKRKKPLVNL